MKSADLVKKIVTPREGFRGLSLGMTEKQLADIEGKGGERNEESLRFHRTLEDGADESITATLKKGKASELQYILELSDEELAAETFEALVAELTTRMGAPKVKKSGKSRYVHFPISKKPPARLWTCAWKRAVPDSADAHCIKVVIDPHLED